MFLQRVVFGLPSIKWQLAIGTANKILALGGWCKVPARLDHLICFASPSSFWIVRPTTGKRCPSRLGQGVFCGVLHRGRIMVLPTNAHEYCPGTAAWVLQVLLYRVVILLPPIEWSFTEKANDAVIALSGWFVVESGLGKLFWSVP